MNILMTMRIILLLLLSPLFVFSQKNFSYQLPFDGKVSLNIYDEQGHIVKQLLSLAERRKGFNREQWDMKNDDGKILPSNANYSWKILLSKGVQSKYIMTIGPTFPEGNNYWEVGLGNHVGLSSVACDGNSLFVASGMAEGCRSHIKMDINGSKCIQSGNQPGAWTGFYARTIIGDDVYGLTQEGMVLAHHKDSLNGWFVGVGDKKSSCVGMNNGFGWNARSPNEKDLPLFQCQQPAKGNYTIWDNNKMWMDIANVTWKGKQFIIISYEKENMIQLRQPRTGTVVKTFTVVSAKGIAGDENGNIYALSGRKLIRINCDTEKQDILYASFTDPYRIDIDVRRKEIIVAERSPLNQIKKISFAGKLLKTYGRKGGRLLGLYNPRDFFCISDIIVDGKGGFYVTELKPVSRLAHFSADGSLIKEWYGGTSWCSIASADETDPSVVWLQFQTNVLWRCKVDYARRMWKIHSVYNTDSIASGIYSLDSLKACGMCGVIGTGDCNWTLRKHNKETYLVFKGSVAVLKVDTVQWKLKGCVSNKFIQSKTRNSKVDILSWTDINGDGTVQPEENSKTETEKYIWQFRGVEASSSLDYYLFDQAKNDIVKLPIKRWTKSGVPVYAGWSDAETFNKETLPKSPLNLSQTDYFSFDALNGDVFVAINFGDKGWADVDSTRMYRFNKDGSLLWRAGMQERRAMPRNLWFRADKPAPGKIFAIKANIAVIDGMVIATDYEGGWNEPYYLRDSVIHKTALTYSWDKDGLFAGDVFDNWDASAAKKWKYQHSSENGAGWMMKDKKSGMIFYMAGCENEVRVYQLKGFADVMKFEGKIE
jgi:hypothetical protein